MKCLRNPFFVRKNDVFIKTYTDIVYYENAKKYTDRFFNDIFSDKSEIGQKYQELKIDFDKLELKNQQLYAKIDRIENNKWFRFSKYGSKKKLGFILNELLKKTGIKKG